MSLLARRLLMRKASAAVDVSDVFSTTLYTGTGLAQTITNGIDLAGEGGLVWIKNRSISGNMLTDTARGAHKPLYSNNTQAQEDTNSYALQDFNSNGFSIGNGNWASENNLGSGLVSWTFRKAAKFFDVVNVSHTNGVATNISLTGLSTLGLVVAKITNTTGDWIAWHRSLTASNNLRLNTTAAQTTTNAWLSVSSTTATISASAPTGTYIIYAFAHDPDGIIQCGGYTGNGSTTGPTVTLGWEPQYIMVKNTTGNGDWLIYDNVRDTSNPRTYTLKANIYDAEVTTGMDVDFTATGFQIKATDSNINTNAATYIYLAIKKAD